MRLCHSLPRDNVVRCGIFIVIVAFIISLVSLGAGARDKKIAEVRVSDVHFADLYWDHIHVVSSAAAVVHPSDCSRSGLYRDDYCSDFLGYTALSGSFLIATVSTAFVFVFIVALVIVPCTSRTAVMLSLIWLLSVVPVTLSLVSVFSYVSGALPNAERFVKGTYDLANVDTARAGVLNADIASAAFYILGFVVFFVRFVVVALTHKKKKEEFFEEHNPEGVVQNRLVNDDAARQREMLAKHAAAVREEFARNPEMTSSAPRASNEPTSD